MVTLLLVSSLELAISIHLLSFLFLLETLLPFVSLMWNFDLRRDLDDADDTKKGFLILNPSIGDVQVSLDCIKLL